MFLPILPKVPGVGAAKAPTLNHRLMVGLSSVGFPTTFGYQELFVDRLKLLLTAITGVKGLPVCATRVPESLQPPITLSAIEF